MPLNHLEHDLADEVHDGHTGLIGICFLGLLEKQQRLLFIIAAVVLVADR